MSANRKFYGRKPKLYCKRGHPRTPDNVSKNRSCIPCKSDPEVKSRIRELNKLAVIKYLEKNPGHVKRMYQKNKSAHAAYERKKNYNISEEEYYQMLEDQAWKCLICEVDFVNVRCCVDHCHRTNKVRGLLCIKCNSGIGLLQDNPDIITKAAEYVRKYKEEALCL